MSSEVLWPISTIRKKVSEIIEEADDVVWVTLTVKRVNVEGDNIIAEGTYSGFMGPNKKFKITLRKIDLALRNYELS